MKLTTGLRSEKSWVIVFNSLLYAHAAHCEGEARWCLIKAFLLWKTIWYIKYEYFYNHCLENRIQKSCLYENAVVVLLFHSPKCQKGFQRMPKFLILNCLQTTKLCKSAPVTYFCAYLCFRYCMTFCFRCSPPGKKAAGRTWLYCWLCAAVLIFDSITI